MISFAVESSTSILIELCDETKSTGYYLSSERGNFSCTETSEAVKIPV